MKQKNFFLKYAISGKRGENSICFNISIVDIKTLFVHPIIFVYQKSIKPHFVLHFPNMEDKCLETLRSPLSKYDEW